MERGSNKVLITRNGEQPGLLRHCECCVWIV